MKRELLKNGVCCTNTGYRALSFNSNLELSPVMYAVYSGYQPNRGTYQVKEEIVLEYRWGHGDPGTLYLNGKPIKEDNPIWKIIKEKYSARKRICACPGKCSGWKKPRRIYLKP